MKTCCTCKISLDPVKFYTSSTTQDGLQRQCKSCKKESNKPEHNKVRCKKYRQKNPETSKKSSKTWRENNPKYDIEYYHKQEDKQKFYDAGARYIRERYKSDPNYRVMKKLKSQIWSYLKGGLKKQSTNTLLGYTVENFFEVCGQGQKDQQIDHKIPVTWFKEDAPINVIWHLDNLQWLDSKQNKTKGNRYADPVLDSYLQIALPHIKENFINLLKH